MSEPLRGDKDGEAIARRFHELYEELAPLYGWETQPKSRVEWADLPSEQRGLMLETVRRVMKEFALSAATRTEIVDIVFDGPPSHDNPRFVEVESPPGTSIKFGEWVHREDGYWAIRFTRSATERRTDFGPIDGDPDNTALENWFPFSAEELTSLKGCRDELNAIHHACLNPEEIVINDDDTNTVKAVKFFIQGAICANAELLALNWGRKP